MMDIKKSYNDDELTIEVGGRIDTVTAPDFESEIISELGDFKSLVLDFKNLEYISSAGLRVLIITQKKLKPDNIPFVIINSSEVLKEIFNMSGFDKFLNIQ